MQLKSRAEAVASRADFSNFINALRLDLKHNPADWTNASLKDFLEALSAWVEDMDGYYQNNNLPIPEQPRWQTVAEMLLAAKYYE